MKNEEGDNSDPNNLKEKKQLAKQLLSPKDPFINVIVGSRGSGKSFLCMKYLTYVWNKRFRRVYCFCPTWRLQPKVWKYIDTKKDWTVYEEFSDEKLGEIIDNQYKLGDKREEILVIIDDISADARGSEEKNLVRVANLGRHIRISVIFLAQTITLTPPKYRRQFDSMVCFAMNNSVDQRMLHSECSKINFEQFCKYLELATEDQYCYLLVVRVGGRLKFYDSKFDELKMLPS